MDTLDFAIGTGSGKGKAVAASLVGVAMLASVGVGWVSTSHGHALGTIRAQVSDFGPGSTFQLLGASGAAWDTLSRHWWRTVDAVHQSLFRIEARYLLGRVLLGPTFGPAELWTVQRPVLEAQLAALIGPVDLGLCYPA